MLKWKILGILWMMPLAEGWICGNVGQCTCTSDKRITCHAVREAPEFPLRAKQGRHLLIQATKEFDLTTLETTFGFDAVTVLGLTYGQCSAVSSSFTWVTCLSQGHETTICPGHVNLDGSCDRKLTTPTPRPYDGSATTRDTRPDATAATAIADTDLAKETTEIGRIVLTSPGIIAAMIIGGLILTALLCCILVSQVSFHERLNLHTQSNDRACCSVYMCRVLIAIGLIIPHLCALCCNCNWRGLRDLDYRGQPRVN